jgi:hypothetical protein
LYTEKLMKIQGKQLYVSMQCTCIEISMAELRESGENMQFLKVIEHANARLTMKEATEPPTFGRKLTNPIITYTRVHIYAMHKAGIELLP